MTIRFLSPHKKSQNTAKKIGAILFFIGFSLLMEGAGTHDIVLVGVMMMIWSGMSWLAYRKTDESHFLVQLFCFLMFLACFVAIVLISIEVPGWVSDPTANLFASLIVCIIFLIAIFT